MAALEFRLLGRFEALANGEHTTFDASARSRELLCYLLIFADRQHLRESLADALWGGCPGAVPRKCLRQSLWQLQNALKHTCCNGDAEAFLDIDSEWLRIRPQAHVWTDVAQLESSFARTRDHSGESLSCDEAALLRDAAALYRGDLLEGWYQEWCLFERERIKSMYLAMLDKLLAYSEEHEEWEAGLTYGSTILRYDPAHERTHWRMMRLHYRAGDRTAAIRQFGACAEQLERSLGIRPGERTTRLFHEICADRAIDGQPGDGAALSKTSVQRVLAHMRQVKRTLAYTEDLVAQDIADIETNLERPRRDRV
jgi:DNA-binding SARP family transcriptional activator